MKRHIAILALSSVFLTACVGASNEINFSTIEVGDLVGAMTVSNVDILNEEMPASEFNANITFDGEVTLTADYSHSTLDVPFYANTICITGASSADLPTIKDNPRAERFCFNDQNIVREAFGSNPGEEGTATFTISQFKWIGVEGETVNWGEFVELLDKEVLVEGEAPVVEETEDAEETEDEDSEEEEVKETEEEVAEEESEESAE